MHPLSNDGALGDPPVESLATGSGAHSIQADQSNKFVFVPHIALIGEPPFEYIQERKGANAISQFQFNENTGRLTPNSPREVELRALTGPRHFCFHPTRNTLYTSDEQGSSVTAYRFHAYSGRLSAFQTISTVPEGYTGLNSCSQIQITSSGKFLYVPNRGHDGIAGFSVDDAGRLTAIGHEPMEPTAIAFSLDPESNFLFAAGTNSDSLKSYRIDGATGQLSLLETYSVGRRPRWVQFAKVGE